MKLSIWWHLEAISSHIYAAASWASRAWNIPWLLTLAIGQILDPRIKLAYTEFAGDPFISNSLKNSFQLCGFYLMS